MHSEIPIVINITVALSVALLGGLVARWLRLPSIVGYLLAGVAIGPFTPGFVGDAFTIQQLAELGVVFLLFGVGLHFSIKDLWQARRFAIPGALIQMAFSTGITVLMTQLWGWSIQAGALLGIAVSIASTVVLLRNLMDHNLLRTTHGQLAVAWLIMEDLATVLILVLLPSFVATEEESLWASTGLAVAKTVAFSAIMLVIGVRVLPWFLKRVAQFHSRELFIVTVMVITMGSAVAATSIFGVSLALGAFIAGVVVGESVLHHQVEAEVLSFRETFAVLFFVSVGMLVNPIHFVTHTSEIVQISLLIIVVKFIVTVPIGLLLSKNGRTALVVGIGLSQIGEFSFLLGQAGVRLGIMTQDQYSLLLAGAIVSIILNPFLFRALPHIEKFLSTFYRAWNIADLRRSPHLAKVQNIKDHVIVIGYGRVGKHIVNTLRELKVPLLVIEFEISRLKLLDDLSIPYLYGDASNSDILNHAHLNHARALILTLPNELSAATTVSYVHAVAPGVPIIARTSTHKGAKALYEYGAKKVIYPELVGAIEIMSQSLATLGYDKDQIEPFVQSIRAEYQLVFDAATP